MKDVLPVANEGITAMLSRWQEGDDVAFREVAPLIYPELHRLAAAHLRREGKFEVQPTELVHEAFLRLMAGARPDCPSRRHFYAIAARLMRQILVDQARRRLAGKRGEGHGAVSLDEVADRLPADGLTLLALHDSLTALAHTDDRKARAVELRYFGGLTHEEIASLLGVSIPTVVRDLRVGVAWLRREMAHDTPACAGLDKTA